jgi:hypothetical protein
MKDDVYSYDTKLYDRSFLNCYQRQSMVMFAERVTDLPLLFYNCLISSDLILEHMLRLNRPKYDFVTPIMTPEALALIGVACEDTSFASYSAAKPTLVAAVEESGYVIPFVDVFYMPHRLEYYRTEHIPHTITLTEFDRGQWHFIDDNHASVLCRYTYPEELVATAYDNGKMLTVSQFSFADYDAEEAQRGASAAFTELVGEYKDSYTLLTGVEDLLSSPWIAPSRAISVLYDAFSLYEGSRTCFHAFLDRQPGYADVKPAVLEVMRRCRDIRSVLMIGKATGRVDKRLLASSCADLRSADEELIHRLRTSITPLVSKK